MNPFVAAVVVAAVSCVAVADDFSEQCRTTADKLMPALKAAEKTAVEGKYAEGNASLLALFPEPRTPAQEFMLANVLYKQEPAKSYAMHKHVAEAMPEEDSVLWEWAMEQHRAREWAGAQATYEKYLKAHANDSSAYGLLAECLIRQGKLREAADTWIKSEKAPGSLERFEKMVFEVHGELPKFKERAELIAKVKAGDAAAAQELVSLDAGWKQDWWNTGGRRQSMEFDLKLIKESKIAPSPGLKAAVCAAEVSLASKNEEDEDELDAKPKRGGAKNESPAAVLKRHGFVLDPAGTLPEHGGLLSVMLAHSGLSEKELRSKFGDRVWTMAKKGKDAELYNAAASIAGPESPLIAEIDQAGWDATGDVRFAASRLLMLKDKLTLNDPLMVKALAQFPEDSLIAAIALRLAGKEGKPIQPYLVTAIQAEYSHFSPQGLLPRPGAAALRSYFAKLDKELKAGAPAGAATSSPKVN